MDRLNFCSSLVTELWTQIYDRYTWEPPALPIEVVNLHESQNMLSMDGLVDSRLAVVLKCVQCTTILFNTHYHSQTPGNGTFIQQCLGFVHSSLIDLEGRLTEELPKYILLGILVYLATAFRIPSCDEQHYCNSLAEKMQLAYTAARPLIPDPYVALDIWSMFMAQICISPTSKQQGVNWDMSKISCLGWDETRRGLQQVMWIDAFHDDLGRRVFEKLAKPR
ncbi:hypothetical protein NM208_g1762 [Fusarium decemcellulare]|uniref:Uncharacterized protein n=1 Tax=Fusarium decemcellulare TaxID=57161 RepID=A0ACC1SUX4_9HYPO|nr:hypothetical protein NM208_g1762 [Fusarium decemcellulare]